jgi:NADH:ubiquinone oxidoreductase subunit D
MALQLEGEALVRLDACFGYLHRGSEKLIETRTFLQALPYFDRFDYVANLFHEHAFCLATEALAAGTVYAGAALQGVRLLLDELSRYLNHLLTLSASALDLGAMGPIFWAFEEREYAFELFEGLSGARMHTGLHRPFDFDFTVLSRRFLLELSRLLGRCGRALAGAFLGLLNNRAFKTRLALVGQLSSSRLREYGITGVIARSAGLGVDLRRQGVGAYGAYSGLAVRTFLGRRGDNLDRFLGRVKEVAESFRLIAQLLQGLLGPVAGSSLPPALASLTLRLDPRRGKLASMEALISHFKQASAGIDMAPGLAYRGVESPKGEVALFLVSTGAARPSRAKLRTPVSHNMHLIPSTSAGTMLADFVATFCAYDIVLGEIDRARLMHTDRDNFLRLRCRQRQWLRDTQRERAHYAARAV